MPRTRLAVRVPADDELLLVAALQLDPVAVARAAVRRVGALAHHAFEALLAGRAEAVGAVAAHVHAVAHVVGRVLQQLLEQLFALDERPVAQVLAVERQQVERQVGEVFALRLAQEALQRLEVGLAGFVGYCELPVEHHRAPVSPILQRARDGVEALGVVVAVARDEACRAAFEKGDDAVAVVLDLEQPVVAGRGRAHELGELHVDALERVADDALVLAAGDLVHRATGLDGRVEARDAGLVLHAIVLLLDEQPVVVALAALRLHVHEHPRAFQAMPVEDELEIAVAQPFLHVHERLPVPFVPQHHGAAAVLALRNGALEGAVVQRVVLHAHGQPLVARVVGRPLRNGPAQQRAVPFETQVVVVARRAMVLHGEAEPPVAALVRARLRCPGRFRRPVEIAFAVVVAQRRSWAPRGSSRIISLAAGSFAVVGSPRKTRVWFNGRT